MACLALAVAEVTCAQSLEKIQWFNEPERWTAEDGILTMQVPPHCDYWRVSHYGFTVDDAPFCYATYGGEFEAKVKEDELAEIAALKERFNHLKQDLVQDTVKEVLKRYGNS